jgi:hypothetical protein
MLKHICKLKEGIIVKATQSSPETFYRMIAGDRKGNVIL